jgi:hypothetical protein
MKPSSAALLLCASLGPLSAHSKMRGRGGGARARQYTFIGNGNCKDAVGWLSDYEKFGETLLSCQAQCSVLSTCVTAAFTSSDEKCMLRFQSQADCKAASLPSTWQESCAEPPSYSETTVLASSDNDISAMRKPAAAGRLASRPTGSRRTRATRPGSTRPRNSRSA